MLIVDTAVASLRHAVFGPQLPPAAPLARLLAAQARAPRCTLGNAGNDAWLALGAMIALIDRTATPLNSATIGGALQAPIPHPPPMASSASTGNLPQLAPNYPARPRYNSTMGLASGAGLPFPTTPPADGFPLPSPNANPNARPISTVFARPRTGSAGAQASPRNTLSLNGLSLNTSVPSLGLNFDSQLNSNPNARPISAVIGRSMNGSPRSSVNLSPVEPGGTGKDQIAVSRSWNGRSTLGSGRPQTPLGLSGGYFEAKPGRSSRLVVSPGVKKANGGNDSTESESEGDYGKESDEEPAQVRGSRII